MVKITKATVSPHSQDWRKHYMTLLTCICVILCCAAAACLTDWITAYMSRCTGISFKVNVECIYNYSFFYTLFKIRLSVGIHSEWKYAQGSTSTATEMSNLLIINLWCQGTFSLALFMLVNCSVFKIFSMMENFYTVPLTVTKKTHKRPYNTC